MVQGSILKNFISYKNQERNNPCEIDEMFCTQCQDPRKIKDDKVYVVRANKTKIFLSGYCSICSTKMHKSAVSIQQDLFIAMKELNIEYSSNCITIDDLKKLIKEKSKSSKQIDLNFELKNSENERSKWEYYEYHLKNQL